MFKIMLRDYGQLDALTFAGHLLALLAIAGLLLVPGAATGPAIVVTAILGLGYTALTLRTRDHLHLYPAALVLTTAYLLSIDLVAWLDAILLWALPLQAAFFALGVLLRRRRRVEFAIPLEVAGTLIGLVLAGKLLLFSPLLQLPILTVAGFGLLALLEFGLARLHRQRWFLLPAFLFLSLVYLFALRFAPGGAPEALLVLFSGTAVAYALLGLWVRGTHAKVLAEPIEAAALLVGFVSGLASLWAGTRIGLNALLVGAVAYGVLFISSRGAEYIYLGLLSAGAIGFQFVRIAGDRFSPQLTDQFLLGLAIVGVVFFYPLARRLIRRDGSLRDWLNDGGWVRVMLVGLPVAILIPAIGVSYTLEATANPTFCGSCHIMQEQYQAWDRSPHRDITCDTCHYPPGAENFVQGKIVGLTEVINNAAGTFGTKPHGTVDDANCEACHAREDLIGVSSPYRGDIKFNHAELAPGKSLDIALRCNSCHAKIVDGYHFEVRESTCYLCHFAGRDEQPTAIGTCATCHATPRDDTHIRVIASQDDNECLVCHTNVTVEEGNVRPERCLACHGRVDPRLGDAQAIHDLHIVSETTFLSRKVECIECHDEITHGEETLAAPVLPVNGS